jgi:hypothetical protein
MRLVCSMNIAHVDDYASFPKLRHQAILGSVIPKNAPDSTSVF